MNSLKFSVQMKSTVSSLYVLKAICAYLVISLHAPIGAFSEIITTLAQISVPIFFMVTGYFLYVQEQEQLKKRLESSIKKVAILWLIINPIMAAIGWYRIPLFYQWITWSKWILMGHHPLYGHLWYITSLLQTLIVFYILTRLKLSKYLYLGIVFWLLRIVFADLRPIIFGSPDTMLSCNFLMTGIPYMATGILIKQFIVQFQKISSLVSVLGVIVAIGLAIVAAYVLPSASPWGYVLKLLCKIILIFSCFLLALRYPHVGANSMAEYIGKTLSANIYYWHLVVVTFCTYFISVEVFNNWGAVIVSILSTIVAYLVVKLQDMYNVKYV